ncbi:MAG: kynureninase [Alphaproteobacteria bacterium]|nr:kynureninase [Alphaproteobacteria bacterium]
MPQASLDRHSPFPAEAPTRADAKAMDARDPLAKARDLFQLPHGVIYLDGNSLGALPRHAANRVFETMRAQWGEDLIAGWTKHGWMDLPARVGRKIGELVGAPEGTLLACDTTTINLYKLLAAALAERPGRRTVVSERGNFPTDLYVADGLFRTLGKGHRLKLVDRAEDVVPAIDADTAAVMLTQVDYRTGALHDMAAVTKAAHAKGALTIWDLAHSAGALPVDLAGADADYAVGCGYKYLNGGPGAPAFLYVAHRLQASFMPALQGWLGHAKPFDFDGSYRPADGIQRTIVSSPPILSLVALESGVDTLLRWNMADIRAKSEALTEIFRILIDGVADRLGVVRASPREVARRGSQVCYRHPDGYAIVQALIERRIVGDFRAPDIMRFGFAPLYLRHVDVWDAAANLVDVIETRAYDEPRYRVRAKVT